jgi:hypothetical protein
VSNIPVIEAVRNKMTDPSTLPSKPSKANTTTTTIDPRTEKVHEFDVNVEYNKSMDDDNFIDMFHNSFEEQCGFVLHVMIVLLSISYTTWILSFYSCLLPIGQNSTGDWKLKAVFLCAPKQQQQQQGPPPWTIILPLAVIFLFFLIPIVYGGCINRSAVVVKAHQKQQSLTILEDIHTIRPRYISPKHTASSNNEYLDDYDATNYYQNPMAWTPPVRNETKSLKKKTTINNNGTCTTTVPDICEIDVADINDLLQIQYIKHCPS